MVNGDLNWVYPHLVGRGGWGKPVTHVTMLGFAECSCTSLPGKPHGWRGLVGCSPWGREESDMTEWPHFHFSPSCIGEGNGNPLQCSCLENPRDGGAWWAAVYGVAQRQLKQLSSSSIPLFTISIPSFYAFVFLRVHSQFWWSTGMKNHCREMVVSLHYFSSH